MKRLGDVAAGHRWLFFGATLSVSAAAAVVASLIASVDRDLGDHSTRIAYFIVAVGLAALADLAVIACVAAIRAERKRGGPSNTTRDLVVVLVMVLAALGSWYVWSIYRTGPPGCGPYC